MKLIDLLVQELPKRGGWPANSNFVVQDDDQDLKFGKEPLIQFERDGVWRKVSGTTYEQVWSTDVRKEGYDDTFFRIKELSDDHATSIVTREQYEAALQQPVWNGEGLPPVGCECDVIPHNNRWGFLGGGAYTGVVIAYDGEDFWFKDNNGVHTVSRTDKVDFRPIRTEAERKRDNFITAIGNEDVIGTYITKDDAELIYDAIAAGKIPGVTLL